MRLFYVENLRGWRRHTQVNARGCIEMLGNEPLRFTPAVPSPVRFEVGPCGAHAHLEISLAAEFCHKLATHGSESSDARS